MEDLRHSPSWPVPRRFLTVLCGTVFVVSSGAALCQVPGQLVVPRKAPLVLKTERGSYTIHTELKEFDSDRDEFIKPSFAAKAKKKAEFPGESFVGTARTAAKLSIGTGEVEEFASVGDLIATLPTKEDMEKKDISTDEGSDRVAEEERNVRLKCFLYAASKEADNDFHLILGDAPGGPRKLMTMELAGLPPSSSASFGTLKAARKAFNDFFQSGGQDRRPGGNYDFYDPPIPVEIAGSLFFDQSHVHGTPPGPSRLRALMPVIWEVHPITKITFEP